MKKLLVCSLTLLSLSAFAAAPQLDDLSKGDVEDVANEFASNFSHTAVAAPETDGLWGVEVGLVGGQTKSPTLTDVVDQSGGDGSDFKKIYHAALMARAHFPYDLFLELSVLPEREISDVSVQSQSLGLGWNAGAFFGLPLDLAVGANFSRSEVSFDQTLNNGVVDVDSEINLKTNSRVLWVGVSKEFLFITPYLKAGLATNKGEVDVDASGTVTIFNYTSSQHQDVDVSGRYFAVGANLQFFFMRLGVEASQTIGVSRVSGKLSVAF